MSENRERHRPVAGSDRPRAGGRRRCRRCVCCRRHLAVAWPPARQDREARTIRRPGSRPAGIRRPAAGGGVVERPFAEGARRTGRARGGDGARRSRRPVLRHRRARRDRQDWPTLDMPDPEEPSAEELIERARAAEEAALAVPGVTNSEGAEAGWGRSRVALAASNGFAGSLCRYESQGSAPRSSAGSGTGMERDYDFRARSMPPICATPAEIGKTPASARSSGSAPERCRPAAARWCSTRASRAALSRAARRDFGPGDRPRHQLSEGPARRAHLSPRDYDHRRPAPAAWSALQAVRWRRSRRTSVVRSSIRAY